MLRTLLSVAICVGLISNAGADLITLDMGDAPGTAGNSFEQNGNFTINGVTFTVSATSTQGVQTAYNANANEGGVNSLNDPITDNTTRTESGEVLTMTLTFNPSSTVTLNFVDFVGMGNATSGHSAIVTTPAGGPVTLFTGSTNVNSSNQAWTPSSPIAFSSGNSFVLTAGEALGSGNGIGLQSMVFNVTSVPEPSSFAFVGLAALGLVGYRRRP